MQSVTTENTDDKLLFNEYKVGAGIRYIKYFVQYTVASCFKTYLLLAMEVHFVNKFYLLQFTTKEEQCQNHALILPQLCIFNEMNTMCDYLYIYIIKHNPIATGNYKTKYCTNQY